ncbi:MAG: RNA polymerase sigma factor [Candidatus Cyclobacteriaceae bacterium M3_2C_046]
MQNQDLQELELVEGIKQHDQESFRQVVEKYQRMVFTTCMGVVHDQADAEDLTQDVFVEVYQSIDKFRQESRLSTWIYRIAINKSLNLARKKKTRGWIKRIENFMSGETNKAYEVPDQDPQPSDQLQNKEQAAVLHQTIDALPENQRVAFTLHKYDDLSYKEIAEVMDLSLSAVESLIHRARKNLQKKLVNYYK